MLFCIITFGTIAQSPYQNTDNKKIKAPINWPFLSLETDSFYGAEINKAYEFLKGKKKKKQIVVAVIDTGFDTEHDDLTNVLWLNKDEVPNNGIDDDDNGYVDDIHGWNFLSNKTKNVEVHSTEVNREYLRLKEKYEGIDTANIKVQDRNEFEYFTNVVKPKSSIAQLFKSYSAMKQISAYADIFTIEMEEKFPGKKFTIEEYRKIAPPKDEVNEMRKIAYTYWGMAFSFGKKQKKYFWEDIIKSRFKLIESTRSKYTSEINKNSSNRDIINDDMNSIEDRNYGSNKLFSTIADHGTHVAGIIGAQRGNAIGMNGIADVKLMLIRAVSSGDEYDKDIALAIRYAVENGADIINMSFGKDLSIHKKWVDSAMELAKQKGVLLVHASGNNSISVDAMPYYPVKCLSNGVELDNFINVGSSRADGSPSLFSNYGQKDVDIFAPGESIYSSVTNNNYKKNSGTSLAAPVVSGIAALIWSYFPELSVQELRKVILQGVTSREGCLVNKPGRSKSQALEQVDFKQLCTSGGIINAYNAVKLANGIAKNK